MLTPEREREIRLYSTYYGTLPWDGPELAKELLAEIDRLREELYKKPPLNIEASQTIPKLFDEIDRLRAELLKFGGENAGQLFGITNCSLCRKLESHYFIIGKLVICKDCAETIES